MSAASVASRSGRTEGHLTSGVRTVNGGFGLPFAVIGARRAVMPTPGSFPSGHTASAFAFAAAVTADLPQLSLRFYGMATAVGYSKGP